MIDFHRTHCRPLCAFVAALASCCAIALSSRSAFGQTHPRQTAAQEIPSVTPVENLNQAWEQAIAVDLQFAAALSEVDAASANLSGAQALRLPTAQLESRLLARSHEPAYLIDATAFGAGVIRSPYLQSEELAGRATVRLPLYTGGKIQHAIDSAGNSQHAAALESHMRMLDLKLAVAAEYIEVLRSTRHLQVANAHLQHVRAQAEDIRREYEMGRTPNSRLLAANVDKANGEAAALKAENRLRAAKDAFNRRMGRPFDAPVRLGWLRLPSEKQDLDALVATALAVRPDLAVLDSQFCHLMAEAERASAARKPQVFLEAAYQWQTNRYQSPESWGSAAVVGSWQPYSGGRVRSEAARYRALAQAVAYRKADLESEIRLEIRRVLLEMSTARQHVAAANRAIEQADELLRTTRRNVQQGTGTKTEMLHAERLHNDAARRHFDALYDAIFLSVRLHHAVGDL